LHERLPGISETAKIFAGVEVTREPIPVLPTAHYNMGGIPTNHRGEVLAPTADDPERVFPRLMAVGEAASVSVHGANRLGTNSLLDLVVFGRSAAARAAVLVQPGSPHPPLGDRATEPAIARFDRLRHARGDHAAGALRLSMQRIMQDHCSVFRTAEVLAEGCRRLSQLADTAAALGIADRGLIWNTDLAEALEFDNLLAQAEIVINSALYRTESRGGHAREDYPARDDANWLKHTLAWRDDTGTVRLGSRPVHLFPLSNEVGSFPPELRVY
jgi:succinate dehydrogenase / fumarate reductase flavoprotein subunit